MNSATSHKRPCVEQSDLYRGRASGLIFRNGLVRPGKHETHESLSPVVEENDSIAVVFALTKEAT